MEVFLLVVQLIITLALISVILLQKNNSDGLSGLSGGSNNNFLSGKTTANILTKTTAILATIFMVNCLVLANLAAKKYNNSSIAEKINVEKKENHKAEEEKNSVPLAE